MRLTYQLRAPPCNIAHQERIICVPERMYSGTVLPNGVLAAGPHINFITCAKCHTPFAASI